MHRRTETGKEGEVLYKMVKVESFLIALVKLNLTEMDPTIQEVET